MKAFVSVSTHLSVLVVVVVVVVVAVVVVAVVAVALAGGEEEGVVEAEAGVVVNVQ